MVHTSKAKRKSTAKNQPCFPAKNGSWKDAWKMLFSCFRGVFFLSQGWLEMLGIQGGSGYHRDAKWYMFVPLEESTWSLKNSVYHFCTRGKWKREGTGLPVPSQKAQNMDFSLAEVALQQALEGLAVAGSPHGAGPVGTPSGLKCSAEVNSACAKIFTRGKNACWRGPPQKNSPGCGPGELSFN